MDTAGSTPLRSLFRGFAVAVPPAKSVFHRAIPYVLSAASVAAALYASLIVERLGYSNLELPLFLLAIASTVWYPAVGPAVLALVLSALTFNYYFTEPRHSFQVAVFDLPYYVAFLLFALMLTGFSVVRRRAERELLRSREQLQLEVAERKQREEQIRHLNQQLEKRSAELEVGNRELEAFAYSISHDLRAPLRHMVGFAELLQQRATAVLDEKSRDHMATILDAAKRMGQLIDDLLAFSRIGRAEAHEMTVSLQQLVNEVVEEMRPDTAGRNISWRIGDLPDLYCDRSMLRLAFVNLIANAVKFTRPRERPEIEIGSFEDDRVVVVFVKDNGVGFDMKYSNKLFRVFQRLHRSEEFEGTGIGLATVERVIQRHSGRVWAEGSVNGGATLSFSVPHVLKR